jgi:hypothetical protein
LTEEIIGEARSADTRWDEFTLPTIEQSGWRRRLKYCDLSLPASREVRVRVVENPGLWMPAHTLADLLESMRAVVRRGIGEDLNYGVLSGDPERLRDAVITLLYERQGGKLIAFNALSYMQLDLRGRPTRALHLGLVMVDPGCLRLSARSPSRS